MRKKIGECLIQAGLITEDDLRVALAEHKRTGERLGVVLVRMNLATEKQIAKALAFQLGFPYVNLAENPPDPAAVVLIPKEVALKRVCIAVRPGEEPADGGDVRSAAVQPRAGSRVPDRLPHQAGRRDARRHHRRDPDRLSRQGAGRARRRRRRPISPCSAGPRRARRAAARAGVEAPSETGAGAPRRRGGLRAGRRPRRSAARRRRSSTSSTSS